MKHKLMDWEVNGYDDSDFFGVYFDTDDGQLHKIELGSTRYAGGYNFGAEYAEPTLEIVELARVQLARLIFVALREAEHRDVMEPRNVSKGDVVRVSTAHKSKIAGQTLDIGTRIRVNDCTAFGKFYRNGYNQPGRGNRSIVGRIIGQDPKPGEVLPPIVRIPLNKCRLDREPLTDAELQERAEKLSHEHNYGAAFGMRAWESNNWARKVAAGQAPVIKEA